MAESVRYLLDTSALLAHFRQEEGWQTVQALFEAEEAELMIASPSLTEFGRRLASLGASEAEITEAITTYQLLFSEVVAIDSAIALAALAIGQRATRRLPLIDALIAGAAQTKSAILVHRDEHMSGIPAALVAQEVLVTPPLDLEG